MMTFAEKYRKAMMAERRYWDAPRKGWADPKGRKSADNQTIEVRRKEAVDLAVMLGSALYNSQVWLREKIALVNYMDQLAEGEIDMMTCETCHNRYRSGWLDGACPYCAASVGAREQVRVCWRSPPHEPPGADRGC